ncbi:nSTAND1 domain-containing NTPase [Sorangium sp. So ce1099]|uniref:nSTAND1 domain-containing NTPase n=1 Tax=Sorangium sp. So ce1099 TaxID=3133331 RepID=UPI003F5F38DA
MLAAAESAGCVSSSPCKVVLELLRATDTENSFAFMLEEQSYVRHLEGGAGRSASFPWSDEVLKRLAALQRDKADPEAAAWLGEEMRSFLDRLGFRLDEESIRRALDDGRPVHVTLRLGAAELFALPWELVPLGATGRPLGSLPGCLLHYEWPGTRTANPEPDPPREGGRILFAWSAAGGVVPADEHLAAIRRACRQGRHRGLDGNRDVLPHASLGRLQAALRAEPTAVLHILCHGGSVAESGASYGLILDSDGGASPEIMDARALQLALADHLGTLRLVVLCACHSGNPGALDSRLGSLAQALHRAGVPAVVASRYPLPVDASIALTASLYEGLLVEDRALSGALLGARDRLRGRAGWASLQMYARDDGPELRPIVRRPYRGLLAFQEEHARYFFGREAEVEAALARLSALISARDPARPRFLLCAGASGTGKSSLVLAGVVPALRARSEPWAVVTLRPQNDWRAALAAALAARSHPDAPLLLVVDQFEELFTAVGDHAEREAFVRELWTLAGHPGSGVSVMATLRVDSLARCGEIRLGSGDRNLEDVAYDEAHRVFIGRMKAEQLRAVVERPAERVGVSLEVGLAEQMIRDAGNEPGALPLLEYVLDQMWQQRRGQTLAWAQYNALGGVGGALEKQADAILAGLDAVRRQAARRLLVQLVALDDGARIDRRRRVPLDRLRRGTPAEAAVFCEVLERLTHERLLVLSEGDDDVGSACRRSGAAAQGVGAVAGRWPSVELAHEQLIRSWRTLRTWMREDEQMLLELQQLERWVAEAAGFPEYVLDADRLRYARGLLKKYPDDIGEAARALIRRSEKAARRKRSWLLALALVAVVTEIVVVAGLAMAAAAPSKKFVDPSECRQEPSLRDAGAATSASVDASVPPPRSRPAPTSKPKTPTPKALPPFPPGSVSPSATKAPDGGAGASKKTPDSKPGAPTEAPSTAQKVILPRPL